MEDFARRKWEMQGGARYRLLEGARISEESLQTRLAAPEQSSSSEEALFCLPSATPRRKVDAAAVPEPEF